VVNGQPNVREHVRKRVLDVIESTGYHPNVAARALASQRSWTIGLVIPRSVGSFFTDPYFPRLLQGIAQACNQANYTLGLFLVSSKEDEDKIFPRVSRRGMLDGMIVQSGQIGDRLIDRLVASGVPLVILGRPVDARDVSYIDVDNVSAAAGAVTYLARLGYDRIATITGPAKSTVSIDRRLGYLRALAEQSLSVDEALVAEGDFTEAGGYEATRRLLAANPNAIFAASDTMAIGGMRAVREAGMNVPGDVAFVGFDDLPSSAVSHPQLTTVHQPIYEFGARAVEVLVDLIENGVEPPRRIIMDTELVVRASCGAPTAQSAPGRGPNCVND
jgi:LacI family transcriptional regulator